MLDSQKISNFISLKRKELGMTQADIANRLKVSYQAVSKWENGTVPNVEILVELAKTLNVSVDTLLNGGDRLTYDQTEVDLAHFADLRQKIAAQLTTGDQRVFNKPAMPTLLYDFQFPEIESPVLVMSPGWHGSKCRLAAKYGYGESAGHDIVNDLVSNVLAMGARPLAVTDCVAMGEDNEEVLLSIIKGISDACKENGCSFIGGSTRIHSFAVQKGAYEICANVVGVASKEDLLDGSAIREGDVILAVASNGPHTTGYTLLGLFLEKMPLIKKEMVEGETFLEQIMKPHASYYQALSPLLGRKDVHGMVNITCHDGMESHMGEIIPEGLCAEIDLCKVRPLPIFRYIKKMGGIAEPDMLSSYNCGMGMWLVVAKESAGEIAALVKKHYDCYEIGEIKADNNGPGNVVYKGKINWEL